MFYTGNKILILITLYYKSHYAALQKQSAQTSHTLKLRKMRLKFLNQTVIAARNGTKLNQKTGHKTEQMSQSTYKFLSQFQRSNGYGQDRNKDTEEAYSIHYYWEGTRGEVLLWQDL